MMDAGIMIVHRDGDIVLWPGAGLAAASAPTVRPLEEAWAGPGPAQCAKHRVTCYTHHTLHVTHITQQYTQLYSEPCAHNQ